MELKRVFGNGLSGVDEVGIDLNKKRSHNKQEGGTRRAGDIYLNIKIMRLRQARAQ